MFKKIGVKLLNNWYKISFAIVFMGIFAIFYLYKLGSFVRGDSLFETSNVLGINSIEPIMQDISLAPIKFAQFLMLKIDEPNSTLLRLVSAGTVLIGLIIFYRLIRKWQTHRMAMLSTLMLGSSAYVLSIGRFSSQETMLLILIPCILLMGTWLKSKKHVKRLIFVLPGAAILMYIPGFLILLFCLSVIFRKRLMLAWKFTSKKIKITGLISSILLLSPLAYSLVTYPKQIWTFLGFDIVMDNGIRQVGENFIELPKQLFYKGIDAPQTWLYGTPILDVVSVIFFVLGVYAFFKSKHTLRARLLFGLLIFSWILISFSSVVTLAFVLPLIYIYISKGLLFMLQNWFAVFPRNPAARNTGAILLFIPVFLSVGYNVEKYFIAWKDSPKTSQALSITTENDIIK